MSPSPLARGHRDRVRRTPAAVLAALVLAAGTCATAPASAAPLTANSGTALPNNHQASQASQTSQATQASLRPADIQTDDGVVLKANVFTPAAGTAGAGPRGGYPVIVQPASWGQNDLEFIAQGKKLADDGYVVVTYTARGFWLSGGEVDVAGPKDASDISSVIDWTLAHTPADPDRIGMTGLSLGAGLTLMGAASDPRIKAVAAMSAWGDMVDSLYSGETRHVEAAAVLRAVQLPTGRGDAEFERAVADHFTGRNQSEVSAWARARSPGTYIDRINAHGTAVLLANAWGDSIFNPDQIAAFYDKLTGPKRLELRPGDHATQELTGLLALPNDTWTSVHRWFDHYLKGVDNGIDRQKPVEFEIRGTGAHESHSGWRDISTHTERLPLGRADLTGTGTLGDRAGTGWRTSILGGTNSGADGGISILSGLLDQVAKVPSIVSLPLLPRSAGAVWQSAPNSATQRIRGSVRLHTTVTSTAQDGTAIAYLYDVDALGVGRLISHAPQSWIGRTPGKAFPLDVSLFATAYDVPAGHRLALVLDTKDPLYAGRSPLASGVTFSSSATDPSVLTVPQD